MSRAYPQKKLQENIDAEIFEVLVEEAKESFAADIVVTLPSVSTEDIQQNCDRIKTWIQTFVAQHAAE